MNKTFDALDQLLRQTPAQLVDISEEAAASRPVPGTWSPKQVLGHLIDSAVNNHQRMVRAVVNGPLAFPGYEQEQWVDVQDYSNARWPDLVNLWLLLNRHLLHVARRVPAEKLTTPIAIGGNPAITLREMLESYVEHMQKHLLQIAKRSTRPVQG